MTAPVYTQDGVDFLSAGITVQGSARFERTKVDDADVFLFTVQNPTHATVALRLQSKYVQDTALISSMWYRKLLIDGDVTLRFADEADAPPGVLLRRDLLQGIVICTAQPQSREEAETLYRLQCVNFDTERAAKRDGNWVSEIDMVVLTPSGSRLDRFLVEHHLEKDAFYVRLEK